MFVDPEHIRNGNQFEFIISPMSHLGLCMHPTKIKSATHKHHKGIKKEKNKKKLKQGQRIYDQ
jgi:hypothetical protein